MSLGSTIAELFSSLFKNRCNNSDFQMKIKYQEKENKKYWKNRYKSYFAESSIEELDLMRSLVDSNNTPVTTSFDVDSVYRKVKVCGVEENLYQVIDKEESETMYYGSSQLIWRVRITVPVFKTFKKEFNKYGRPRLSGFGRKEGGVNE